MNAEVKGDGVIVDGILVKDYSDREQGVELKPKKNKFIPQPRFDTEKPFEEIYSEGWSWVALLRRLNKPLLILSYTSVFLATAWAYMSFNDIHIETDKFIDESIHTILYNTLSPEEQANYEHQGNLSAYNMQSSTRLIQSIQPWDRSYDLKKDFIPVAEVVDEMPTILKLMREGKPLDKYVHTEWRDFGGFFHEPWAKGEKLTLFKLNKNQIFTGTLVNENNRPRYQLGLLAKVEHHEMGEQWYYFDLTQTGRSEINPQFKELANPTSGFFTTSMLNKPEMSMALAKKESAYQAAQKEG
ncbi:hypothetical protein ACMXYX_17705 (plasmid) [Neptuniibacter sp. QD72_48]|uniref:hypothetical protein n=1 Tax=Neptuniibacter sp. QD72_48 TaxID=3398214 RepID=UPI0039F4D8DE